MAHHGSNPLSGMDNNFLSEFFHRESKAENLGATNKFPDGKLNNADEGEIMFGIAEYEGRIILNFGKPVTWFGLTKEQAKETGELLIKKSGL